MEINQHSEVVVVHPRNWPVKSEIDEGSVYRAWIVVMARLPTLDYSLNSKESTGEEDEDTIVCERRGGQGGGTGGLEEGWMECLESS